MPRLGQGSAVTTLKNTVDKVVTEREVAEMRGKSVRERTRRARRNRPPRVPRQLEVEARAMGWW